MNGVTVGGTKYMFLQSDDHQIQAKKGAAGVSIAKAGKCKLGCFQLYYQLIRQVRQSDKEEWHYVFAFCDHFLPQNALYPIFLHNYSKNFELAHCGTDRFVKF